MRIPLVSPFVALFLAACSGAPTNHTPSPVATAPSSSTSSSTLSSTNSTPTAPTVIKRIVVSFGRNSGTSVTTTAPDGTTTLALFVVSNGRGPKVDATWKLGPDGTPQFYQAKGHHTLGTNIDESFTREGAHVRWKGGEEQGEKDLAAPAFFLPMAPTPDMLGLLCQTLLKHGKTMDLLPGGKATLEKTVEATVRIGDRDERLMGYRITGLDLTPTHVWMKEDGTWFGSISYWFSAIPEGAESVIPVLLEKQNQIDKAEDARQAKEFTKKPPAAGLAFTHARVLDVEHGKWLTDQTVVIQGETIRSVGPSKTTKTPKDAEVIDLTGKAILPGLWDMHAHLFDADGILDIASGVTTARDVGNDPDKLDDFMRRFDSGESIGPHILRFGFIEGRNEKAAASKVTAETEAEAHAAVEFFAKRGYEGIKIYNSVRPELIPILTKDAHQRKMAVTGHIPVHVLAHEAIAAGYDGIEHINMLFLNFFATHETDTRDTTRFTLVGDKAASFDLKSKPVKDFITLLAEHHTIIDPTLNAFEGLLVAQPGKVIPGSEWWVERLPLTTQRMFLMGGLPLGDKVDTYRASFAKLLDMVKLLAEAKVPLVLGTDSLAGLTLHHEMGLFVRAGISPADVLRMATLDSARLMKRDKTTGTITPGKTADLFVVDGDPLVQIRDASHVITTVRGGVMFDAATLYAAIGVRPSIRAPVAAK